MARIEFADGTFTTRESHEVDPHVAVPDNIELVDHGPVVTTGLPPEIPQTALGVEFVEKEPEPEVVEPEPVVHRRAAPRPRAAQVPSVQHPEPAHLVSEMDDSGSVPQGRISLESSHAAGRGDSERAERATDDRE